MMELPVKFSKIITIGVDVPIIHAGPGHIKHAELFCQFLGKFALLQTLINVGLKH